MPYEDEEARYQAMYADEKYRVLSMSAVVLTGQLKPLTTLDEVLARQRQAAARLKARYSEVPSYARKAARDPNYWMRLAESRINFL